MDERKVEIAASSHKAMDEEAAALAEQASAAAPGSAHAASGTSEAVEIATAPTAPAKAAAITGSGVERPTELAGPPAVPAAERASAVGVGTGAPGPAGGIGARALLGVLLAVPLLWLLVRWTSGVATYGEVVSRSGFWAALLLIPTTLVTPSRRLFPRARWVGWINGRRHDLGVACVTYAVFHTVAYAIGKGSLVLILRDARQPWLLAGWFTLVVFMTFAAIRGGAARRGPRPSWTKRHRIIYAGAALVVLHWAFSAFDPLTIQVQVALQTYGYYSGPIDGIVGPRTRKALWSLQRDYGLEVTGSITPEVLGVIGVIAN